MATILKHKTAQVSEQPVGVNWRAPKMLGKRVGNADGRPSALVKLGTNLQKIKGWNNWFCHRYTDISIISLQF